MNLLRIQIFILGCKGLKDNKHTLLLKSEKIMSYFNTQNTKF